MPKLMSAYSTYMKIGMTNANSRRAAPLSVRRHLELVLVARSGVCIAHLIGTPL